MARRDIKALHPDLQTLCQQFLNLCATQNIDPLLICTYRSNDEQNALYAQGRTILGRIVTWAKGGESPHNTVASDGSACAKAFDVVPLVSGKIDWSGTSAPWKTMYALGSQLGLDLGHNFPPTAEGHSRQDDDHFQLMDWKDIPCP